MVFLKNRENKINWDSCTIAGTLRNGLGQLVRLLGHSETVWDSWCNCWDTPKQFGTVGAVTGTLIQKLFFVEASTVYNYFFYICITHIKAKY